MFKMPCSSLHRIETTLVMNSLGDDFLPKTKDEEWHLWPNNLSTIFRHFEMMNKVIAISGFQSQNGKAE